MSGQSNIYFARCVAENGADMGAIKIGCSFNYGRRIKMVNAGLPFTCELLAHCPGDMLVENVIHFALRSHKIRGEFFRSDEPVMAMVSSVAKTGLPPFPDLPETVKFHVPNMDQAREFMRRHDLTIEQMAEITGVRAKSYEIHMQKSNAPNRRFVSALVVCAMEKGIRPFDWHDFSSTEKAAA